MDYFFEALGKFVNFSEDCKRDLASVIVEQNYKKGEILVKPDEVCGYLWFMEKGVARVFFKKDGKEVTEMLTTEGYFFGAFESFLSRQPSKRGVQVLEDSTVLAIEYNDLEGLYTKYHEMERLGRLISNRGLLTMIRRADELLFSSALQRYQLLMESNPGLLQRVPLGIIASYLGITQETLSRMRSQY